MTSLEFTTSGPDFRNPLWRDLGATLRENCLLFFYALLVIPAPIIVAHINDIPVVPFQFMGRSYFGFALFSFIALFCSYGIWYIYHRRIRRTPNFEAEAWAITRRRFWNRERIILALPPLLMWPFLATSFSYLKSVMPLVNPFYLDQALMEWDRLLHFGVDPWRLLAPFTNHIPVTFVINVVYTLWLFVFHALLVLQSGAAGDRRLRMQFILTMALTWTLVGNLAATLMSSAGPCYYDEVVGGENPFAPLMAYLQTVSDSVSVRVFDAEHRIPLTALLLQDMLWQSQMAGDYGIAKGISASPSMHVASTFVIVLLCFNYGRRAIIAGLIFLAFIFVGSIHLGWHYAIDGYLGAAGAFLIWKSVGWLLNRRPVQDLLWPQGLPAIRR